MIRAGASALENCSFNVHLNENETEPLNKLSPDLTFNNVMIELQNKTGIYLPTTTYSFWIKTGVEEKKSIFSAEKWYGKPQDKDDGYIQVKMDDTIAGSTYGSFYKHGRMDIWLKPSTTDIDRTRLFETSLEVLYSRSDTPETSLLPILKSLFDYINTNGLDEVGIFRLSGSAKEGNEVKKSLDQGKPLKTDLDVVLAASLIKFFFRNLPEPLISGEYWDQIRTLFSDGQVSDEEQKIEELRTVIQGMPTINVTILEHLMSLCRSVTKHQDENKMTTENLSIVIGPNIMGPRSEDGTSLMDTSLVCVIAKFMMEKYSFIFRNNSPYDPTLKGWNEMQDISLRLAISPQAVQPRRQSDANSPPSPVAADKKNKDKVFRGYMPRSIFENTPIPNTRSMDGLRLTPESLISQHNNALDWELPYVTITQITHENNTAVICYKRNKKSDQTDVLVVTDSVTRLAFTYQYTIKDWCEHFQYVLDRYQMFISLANEHPDRYGAVISKDAFMQAKKKKEAAKVTTVLKSPDTKTPETKTPDLSKQVTPPKSPPLPVIPFDEESENGYGDDEYDSDSDDSIEFRVNKKK
ncbi:ArhGAP [Acrasis kona]|uniref:ArhGAP n=1 Tax=Acrasis kona TaxID=1008807 RepID=A0AAW2YIM0_9EUKA